MVEEHSPAAPLYIQFPGMDETEIFQFYYCQHWLRLLRSAGVLFLWMIGFAVLTYVTGVWTIEDALTRRVITIGLALFFLIPNITFLVRLYTYFLYVVIVTDRKVHRFKRTLLAMDRHENIDLSVLQDLQKSQRGIVQNMLGFGTLILEAQNTQLIIHFTPRIDTVYNAIIQLRGNARNQIPPPTPPPTGTLPG